MNNNNNNNNNNDDDDDDDDEKCIKTQYDKRLKIGGSGCFFGDNIPYSFPTFTLLSHFYYFLVVTS